MNFGHSCYDNNFLSESIVFSIDKAVKDFFNDHKGEGHPMKALEDEIHYYMEDKFKTSLKGRLKSEIAKGVRRAVRSKFLKKEGKFYMRKQDF